jgi:hypothetical protein
MRAIISVFKGEFEGKAQAKDAIAQLTDELNIVADAYIFSAKPGKLFEILSILRDHKITYGTHFDTSDGPRKNKTVKRF